MSAATRFPDFSAPGPARKLVREPAECRPVTIRSQADRAADDATDAALALNEARAGRVASTAENAAALLPLAERVERAGREASRLYRDCLGLEQAGAVGAAGRRV